MSGLMLGLFLATLDQTIVGVALPTIVGEFHRADLLSWVITAYLLTSTISTPLFGKASDLFGRKRLLQLSIVIFLVGSALCGLAQNMAELIGFRALQGVGAGGLLSLTLAVVADIIPARERGRYQGYFGAVFASSSVIGPLLGGFFVDQATWRWCFYINIPLGLAALIVINRVLHLPFTARRVSIDWAGAGLLVAGVSALLLAVQMGGRDFAWTSPQLLSLVGGRPAPGRRLRGPPAGGARADPAAAAFPQWHLPGGVLHRVPVGRGHVRRDHLPAAIPAAGTG